MAAAWGRHFRRLLPFSHGRIVWTPRFSYISEQTFRALTPFICQFKTFQTSSCILDNNSFKSYTDEDWRKRLTSEQYHICREKGTEPPWSGQLLDNKQPGVYSCVCCDSDLFDSSTKFDSESGWPSFWSAIEQEHTSVDQVVDNTLGMVRVEVLCNQCGSHLGHVFSDGPKPTGLRYCVNSVALKFKPSVTG